MTRINSRSSKQIKKRDIFVSVVVVPEQSGQGLDEYCKDVVSGLSARYNNYEVVIIDNSINRQGVLKVADLLDTVPCLRIIRLSRKYSHDIAVIAGLEASIGDYTVVTNPDIDPIDNIFGIVEQNMESDIVQGVSSIPTSRVLSRSNLGRRLFYWYNRKYIAIDVPIQATYFMALSRRAVRALTVSTRQDNHIRHMIKTIGYTYSEYIYDTKTDPVRAHGIGAGMIEALDIITSHSVQPLRFMSWVGLFASVLNLIYACYVVAIALTQSDVAEGWTTTSLVISSMFFFLFLFMIVLSEYIGKILVESRRDARYHVLDELCSTVSLADADRKNVEV